MLLGGLNILQRGQRCEYYFGNKKAKRGQKTGSLIGARYEIDEMLGRGNSNYEEICVTLSFPIKVAKKVGGNKGKLEI